MTSEAVFIRQVGAAKELTYLVGRDVRVLPTLEKSLLLDNHTHEPIADDVEAVSAAPLLADELAVVILLLDQDRDKRLQLVAVQALEFLQEPVGQGRASFLYYWECIRP